MRNKHLTPAPLHRRGDEAEKEGITGKENSNRVWNPVRVEKDSR
jgi:hypothetical protein